MYVRKFVALILVLFLAGCDAQEESKSTQTGQPAETKQMAQAEQMPGVEPGRDYMKHFVVQGNFDDVREYITLAISERGIKINNVSHIGKMLNRTAEAVGATKKIFNHAQAIEFCSSTISRVTMEADPHNIVFCPYIIAVYEIADQPGTIHVSFRRPQQVGTQASKDSLLAVEKLLDEIIASAIQ